MNESRYNCSFHFQIICTTQIFWCLNGNYSNNSLIKQFSTVLIMLHPLYLQCKFSLTSLQHYSNYRFIVLKCMSRCEWISYAAKCSSIYYLWWIFFCYIDPTHGRFDAVFMFALILHLGYFHKIIRYIVEIFMPTLSLLRFFTKKAFTIS